MSVVCRHKNFTPPSSVNWRQTAVYSYKLIVARLLMPLVFCNPKIYYQSLRKNCLSLSEPYETILHSARLRYIFMLTFTYTLPLKIFHPNTCKCTWPIEILAFKVTVPLSVAQTILTLILLTWRIWCAPNNASKRQMGFNSAFKGLKLKCFGYSCLH